MVAVVRNRAVGHPGANLIHVDLAVNPCEFGENVGSELRRVGSDDPAILIDPHNRRDVADRVELGELMVSVNEHRVGDPVCQLDECLNILVDRDRDDREIVVDKFVMEGLPPGQIKGAPSPTREGHQQPFPTRPVRERMRRSVEIRKCEL